MDVDMSGPLFSASQVARRAWPLIPRLRRMLDDAESAYCSGRDSAMCGELEDMRRLINEILEGDQC